jgi:EpsD family peptidyl-prolyl cis-trans isomerase
MKGAILPTAALAVTAALTLAACGNAKPTGQVVAKVGKEEITALDLQAELGGYKAPNPQARKAAEQAALQRIIQRKVLAQAAHEQKIDRTPEYARLRTRQDELLTAKLWEDSLARAVPPPNADEVQQYIDAHPDSFAQRKIIGFDAVRFASSDPSLRDALKPLNTLDQIKALLDSRQIKYQAATGQVDALTSDPAFVEQLLKLKSTDVFAMPTGGMWTVGAVRDIKVVPVTGQPAVARATEIVRLQRMREAVGRRFNAALTDAQKTITYNKAYEPAPAPKAEVAKAAVAKAE